MGSQAGIWLIILTVAVAVGIGFLVPVLFELRRSAKRLTSVLEIAEQSFKPLLRDLNATVQRLDRVTSDIGAVTDDVRVFSSSIRRVGKGVGELSGLVSVAGLGSGAGRTALQVGIGTGLTYLVRKLVGSQKRRSMMSNCESTFSGRSVILSLFVGAVAGAALVLLLAPKTRRESAERIRELSNDLKERASATADTAKEGISSTLSRGRDFLGEQSSAISSAVEAGKEAYGRRKALD